MTTNTQNKTRQGWLWFHPFENYAGIMSRLPNDTDVLISFSTDESSSRISHLIESGMSPSSILLTNAAALQKQLSFAKSEKEYAANQLAVLLEQACSRSVQGITRPLSITTVTTFMSAKNVAELPEVEVSPCTQKFRFISFSWIKRKVGLSPLETLHSRRS